MADDSPVGFIGLGIMGRPMALNLLRGGVVLVVFNRTPGRAGELLDAGAVEVSSPGEVARRCGVIITIVTDTPDVEEVLFGRDGVVEGIGTEEVTGAVEGDGRRRLLIDMSTIAPAATRAFAEKLAGYNASYIDAPVSGGDVGAREGTLTIMVGGSESDFDRALPLLRNMGSRVTHVGPVGAGQTVKAANQTLGAINLMAVCETLTLARAAGVDLEKMYEVLTGGAANSWALEKLGRRIIDDDMRPGFMVKLIQKDLRIVQNLADQVGVQLPSLQRAIEQFDHTAQAGHADSGTQALIKVYERPGKRDQATKD